MGQAGLKGSDDEQPPLESCAEDAISRTDATLPASPKILFNSSFGSLANQRGQNAAQSSCISSEPTFAKYHDRQERTIPVGASGKPQTVRPRREFEFGCTSHNRVENPFQAAL